jgi:hypothetical protein
LCFEVTLRSVAPDESATRLSRANRKFRVFLQDNPHVQQILFSACGINPWILEEAGAIEKRSHKNSRTPCPLIHGPAFYLLRAITAEE